MTQTVPRQVASQQRRLRTVLSTRYVYGSRRECIADPATMAAAYCNSWFGLD